MLSNMNGPESAVAPDLVSESLALALSELLTRFGLFTPHETLICELALPWLVCAAPDEPLAAWPAKFAGSGCS